MSSLQSEETEEETKLPSTGVQVHLITHASLANRPLTHHLTPATNAEKSINCFLNRLSEFYNPPWPGIKIPMNVNRRTFADGHTPCHAM